MGEKEGIVRDERHMSIDGGKETKGEETERWRLRRRDRKEE
jgi:hypothetical protein